MIRLLLLYPWLAGIFTVLTVAPVYLFWTRYIQTLQQHEQTMMVDVSSLFGNLLLVICALIYYQYRYWFLANERKRKGF